MFSKIKRGFLLGKFMPLHKGHEALIRHALDNCDELTILVCSLPTEPIDGVLRYNWMKQTFPQARVFHCDKILPQEPRYYNDNQFWQTWKNVIQSYHPEEINVIFGSEPYVETLAILFTTETHFCGGDIFDYERKIVPVSGTMVRSNPMKYWDYINPYVQNYFTKRVLITGVESTGKSTLTENLANYYQTRFQGEYARIYIDTHLDGDMNKLTYEDFDIFASRHRCLEDIQRNRANKVLFTDTDAITTLIFSREYFGKVSQKVIELANSEQYDLVLLCNPDVPWVDDGQRNLSHRRLELHEQFIHEFDIRGMKYVNITGSWDERWRIATDAIDNLIQV